jgi:hypothetical protein
MTIEFGETPEFTLDLKRLLRKFRSLTGDLETARHYALKLFHENGLAVPGFFPMPGFCVPGVTVYKFKRLACRSLGGSAGQSRLRIIYAYIEKNRRIEFIEIYFKGEQENEDQSRIKRYLKEKCGDL